MTSSTRRDRAIACSMMAIGLAALLAGVVLAVAAAAHADSTPVGPLPAGPVTSTTAPLGQLVAVALPGAPARTGLVWRVARPYNPKVVREVSEADVGRSVVIVYRVVGRGSTALVFGLTRGDTSSVAVKSITHEIRSA